MSAQLHVIHTGPRRTLTLEASPGWMTDTARRCNPDSVDPDIFFSTDPQDQNAAKKLCRLCPFVDECADWADQHGERWGVWGGRVRSNSHHNERHQVAA